MDFKRLMQQAQANQFVIERKHERHKQQKEVEQKVERTRQLEEEKRACTRLKEFKAAAERKRLEYKGIVGTTAVPQEAHRTTPPSTKDKPSVDNGRSKPTDKRAPHSGTRQAPSPSSRVTSKQNKTKSSVVPSNNGGTVAGNSGKVKLKTPVNFQALMKMAQQKSSEFAEKEKLSVRESTSRESSPLGRSLLEKTNPRLKNKRTHDMMDRGVGPERTPNGPEGTSNGPVGIQRENRKASASPKPPDNVGKGSQSQRSDRRVAKSSERDKNKAGTTTSRTHNGMARHTATSSSHSAASNKARPIATNRTPLPQQQRLNPKPRPTKSFYGAASARLIQDGRPKFHTRHAPMKYTSSWVDEMSDYMSQRAGGKDVEEWYSDEEDEDLSDFVASDDDDGGEEYSSAIKEIFGYDRRRYTNDVDDSAMESSYAQQMFEEQRSSRIGHQEDAEDIRKEKEEIARKRRKQIGGKAEGLIQSKLKFR